MNYLDDSSILITGGTGSFGRALLKHLLNCGHPRRIAILSRDELKQSEMRKTYPDPRIRWFLGDVRDSDRLRRAFQGVDFVIHAAALKQVDTAEYNPHEFVKTNILGSQNVIDAALDSGVTKVVALSTDKASSPINLYGATKLTADKLFMAANIYSTALQAKFSVVRYGNVLGSRGSVVPLFRRLANEGRPLPVTDTAMTRFWITLDQAVHFVLESLRDMHGGELFVPRIPSMRLIDLVEAISPRAEIELIGIRPGEKLHEEMIAADDSLRTVRLAERFVVLPTVHDWRRGYEGAELVPQGFSYRSDTNDVWLSVEDLRELLEIKNDSV